MKVKDHVNNYFVGTCALGGSFLGGLAGSGGGPVGTGAGATVETYIGTGVGVIGYKMWSCVRCCFSGTAETANNTKKIVKNTEKLTKEITLTTKEFTKTVVEVKKEFKDTLGEVKKGGYNINYSFGLGIGSVTMMIGGAAFKGITCLNLPQEIKNGTEWELNIKIGSLALFVLGMGVVATMTIMACWQNGFKKV